MSTSSVLEVTDRTRLRRRAQRGSFDRDTVYAILDEALVCHVGFVDGDTPFVLPTVHTRVDDLLVLHGARGNRMLQRLVDGAPVCVTATAIDGLVLGRSAMHHSMNYRCVVLLGHGTEVEDPADKSRLLLAMIDRVVPGRAPLVRAPDPRELAATRVVTIPIEEASAKIRSGPPIDAAEDHGWPVWAGVVPLVLRRETPIPAPDVAGDHAAPAWEP